ncbi:MAG: NAD-dependent epimerase/dehydratase family protein [Anaerolineales bacterium]|jgi:dihydroflavonol-4-reductase
MIVVTGASGLLGGNLVRELLKEGHRVRCVVHHDCRSLDGLDVEIVHGDVRKEESMCKAFKSTQIVYHLAGEISLKMDNWSHMEAINVVGVRNVVNACLACNVDRLIHFSSIHAKKQKPFHVPLDESRDLVGKDGAVPYDWSKAAGEIEVRKGIAKGLDAVIINPTGILGPYDYKPSFFGKGIIWIAKGFLPILVNGGFNWVDARDVAVGAIKAAQTATPGSNYLLGGHWRSLVDIGNMVSDILGKNPPYFSVPLWLAYLGIPIMHGFSLATKQRNIFTRVTLHSLNSNRKIRHDLASRELGYQPRTLNETITDVLSWFSMNGYL